MHEKLLIYKNKKVFITGNSGFKGAWLSIFLKELGAKVIGYSDKIKWEKSVFDYNSINNIKQIWGDIRDYKNLEKCITENNPDFIFHLAAQPLVIEGFKNPFDTFTTNISGTLNLLDIVYKNNIFKPVVIVTSDKVYNNQKNANQKFSEDSTLGGNCPYSTSKVICEILGKSYRDLSDNLRIRIVRGGNVLGGGDWSSNRIIPDLVNSIVNKSEPVIRNPKHIRPWSYVLDIVFGYLLVGLDALDSNRNFDSFNIGSLEHKNKTVLDVAKLFLKSFEKYNIKVVNNHQYKESNFLSLDTSKARNKIFWSPMLNFEEIIRQTASWYKRALNNEDPYIITKDHIDNYFNLIFKGNKKYA